MSFVLLGCDHGTDFSGFRAVTIQRTGSLNLDMNPDDAFPLFTAPGEVLWEPGWEPHILNGDGYEEGTVWVTAGHGHTAYWYVAAYDTADRHAQYLRVTPGANTGIVDVQVKSNRSGGSTVNVMYRLTGLSPAGNSNLEKSFSESSYAEMMEDWRRAINENRDKIYQHYGSKNLK